MPELKEKIIAKLKKLPLYPISYGVTITAIVVLAVLILMRMAIIPGWPVQATSTPTPTKVLLNYNNVEYNFNCKFPQYWLESEPLGYMVVFGNPLLEDECSWPMTINIIGLELPEEVISESLRAFVLKSEERAIADAIGQGSDYSRMNLYETTVDEYPAVVLSWRMENTNATIAILNKQAFFLKDDWVYIITYSAQEEYFHEWSDSFDLVTSTFQFYVPSNPLAVTEETTGISTSEATLHGTLTDTGSARLINTSFLLTMVQGDYDEATTIISPESPLSEPGPFTAILTGLAPKTTYYYKAAFQGSGNRLTGDEKSFTTK